MWRAWANQMEKTVERKNRKVNRRKNKAQNDKWEKGQDNSRG